VGPSRLFGGALSRSWASLLIKLRAFQLSLLARSALGQLTLSEFGFLACFVLTLMAFSLKSLVLSLFARRFLGRLASYLLPLQLLLACYLGGFGLCLLELPE
jgi:hypothetical protein